MSEALPARFVNPQTVSHDVLAEPLFPLPLNDNETTLAPLEGERLMFELPTGVWRVMFACYAVFLIALLAATGGARAGFAIAVSAIYVTMFFGTAKVMLGQGPKQPGSPLNNSGGRLQTIYGPLARSEVFGQVLIVPAAVAFFGIAVAVVIASMDLVGSTAVVN